MPKFSYKTMAMKLSEASAVLDDRIDEFRQLIQEHHNLEDSAFGNPSRQSPSEIIAVGRITSEFMEGKLNVSSLILEGSRKWGRGMRVPLKLENVTSYNFFPGQIVALRGTNASGDTPESDPSSPRSLTVLIAAGPYTTDQNLDFAPLQTLLNNAAESVADAVILIGPFLDAEHPLIRTGDFDLPPHTTSPDQATMTDLFRHHISSLLQTFTQRVPTCSVILVPSLRDAHHKHLAFPQDKFVKKELALSKSVQCVTNPMTLRMNEFIVGMSSLDVLDMFRREEIVGGKARTMNIYERGARNVIEQRSFLPIFPPTAREKLPAAASPEEKLYKDSTGDTAGGEAAVAGAEEQAVEDQGPSPFLPLGTMLDTSYLKLGEMLNARPDVQNARPDVENARPDMLITPSVLQGTVKVSLTLILLLIAISLTFLSRSLNPS
jgi:DNA polymerase alpha subunit B